VWNGIKLREAPFKGRFPKIDKGGFNWKFLGERNWGFKNEKIWVNPPKEVNLSLME